MNTSSDTSNSSSANSISEQAAAESQAAESQAAESQAAESLDPQQTTAEIAALAAHLQRAGIMWLPRPNQHSTEQIAARFPVGTTTQLRSSDSGVSQSNRAQVSPDSAGSNPDSEPPASHKPAHSHKPAQLSGGVSSTANTNGSPQPAIKRPTTNRPSATRPAARLQGVSAIQTTEHEYSGDPQPTDQRTQKLQQLAQAVESCTLCPALASCRHKTVFGEGNTNPRFAFFGEVPGEEEDLSGRPFVGKAGNLLTKMLQACTLQRDDVYILNTVKCRPPGNRNPEGDELSNCRSYYQQQFEMLRPEYIVCLGAVSAQELLGTKLSVGRLRGTLHRYFASKVLVTYHPAYLLRNPAAKKAAWADLQYLMRDAGIQIPKR